MFLPVEVESRRNCLSNVWKPGFVCFVIYEVFVYFGFPALVVFGFVSSILAKRLIGRLEEHLQNIMCVE